MTYKLIKGDNQLNPLYRPFKSGPEVSRFIALEGRPSEEQKEGGKHSSERALPYSAALAAFFQPVETPASNKTASTCPHMTGNKADLSTLYVTSH